MICWGRWTPPPRSPTRKQSPPGSTALLEMGEPFRERSPQHSVSTKSLAPCASQPGGPFSLKTALNAPPPPILANPGQDSESRPIVLQLTEDDDGGDLSDDRNCNAYPEQKENSASLPEYAGQSRAGNLANLLHGV